MAINFPTSLDNFTNPSSGNTLDSPSHSLQHSDLNDAVEALEAKLGVGASPAGSATSGQVLTAQGGGTAIWATPDSSGAWTTYTPTWTNLTVGNATQSFKYKQIGKTVFVTGLITLGSTSSITGLIQFTNPVNHNTSNLQWVNTNVLLYRGGFNFGYMYPNGTGAWYIRALNSSTTYLSSSDTSSTVPGTWTTGDFIAVQYVYEAA